MSEGIFAQFRATQQPRAATTESNTSSDPIDDIPLDDSNMSSNSRKRSRDTTNDEDEVEIEAASSSFRNNLPHKRPRVAPAVLNDDSELSEEEEEEEPTMDGGREEEEASEIDMLDDESDNDEESAIDELRFTQIIGKQMKEYRENQAAEEGVIEEVFCNNFMCHSKLRIKLGPLINFIIGHNGSGKSAVLTALTVCLGESARKTNRGGNLKGMIKEGEEHASLAVKIRNRGEGAYKPELYGRSIIVERNFSRSGSNGYKLKNVEGKTVTTKKADLDDLLDYFGLQIDNPINVLTQDLARQFLSNSTPAEKYKFFIRGTRLEELDRDYNVMEENLDKIMAKLVSREEDIPELKLRFEQAEARKKKLEKAESIGRRLNEATNQHAWAQVGEQEVLLEQYGADVDRAAEHVQELEEQAEVVSGEYEGSNQTFETTERLVNSLKEQLVPCEEQRAAKKEAFDAAKAELHNAMAEEREIREHMKKSKDNVARLEAQSKEERERIANAEGGEHAERLERLEELKAAVDEAKGVYREHLEKQSDLKRAQKETYDELEAARASRDRQQEKLTEADRSLHGLRRSQGNPLAGFGGNMRNLIKAINRDSRWRQKPVGPMGLHVRLQKAMWSHQLERTFGGVLNAFVVTNNDDHKMLKALMKKEGVDEIIYIGHPDPLENLHLPDDRSIDTILSVLNIDNHLVRNQLIINQAIEQTLLIRQRAAAERLLNSNGRLRNVRAAISIGNDPELGVRQDYSGDAAARSSYITAWNGVKRMQIDYQQQISHEEQVVAQHKQAVADAEELVREKQQVNHRAGQDLKKWERDQQRLKTAVQQAEDAVEEQNNEIEAYRPKDGRLQELEKQLQESRDDLESYGASYQDGILAKDKLSEASAAAKHSLDEADAECRAGKARLEQAEEKLSRYAQDRRSALFNKNEALNAVDAAKREHEGVVARRDRQIERVRDFTQGASEICRRVPLPEGTTTAHLDTRITRLGDEMEQQRKSAGGSAEELVLRWQQAKNEYEDAVAQLESAKRRKHVRCPTFSRRATM